MFELKSECVDLLSQIRSSKGKGEKTHFINLASLAEIILLYPKSRNKSWYWQDQLWQGAWEAVVCQRAGTFWTSWPCDPRGKRVHSLYWKRLWDVQESSDMTWCSCYLTTVECLESVLVGAFYCCKEHQGLIQLTINKTSQREVKFHDCERKLKAESRRQKLKLRLWRNSAFCLTSHSLLGYLSCISWSHLPRDDTSQSGQDPPLLISN